MIRPLQGQCLIEMLGSMVAAESPLKLPDVIDRETKQGAQLARVISFGTWKKNSRGFHLLPEFAPGSTVIVSNYGGEKLTYAGNQKLKLVKIDAVLAVLTPAADPG